MTRKKFSIAVLIVTSLVFNTTAATTAYAADMREGAGGGEQSKGSTQTTPSAPVAEGQDKSATDASSEIKESAAGACSH